MRGLNLNGHVQVAVIAFAAVFIAKLVAAAWVWVVGAASFGLRTIPDLLEARFDGQPAGLPWITVIVPARNEAVDIAACLQSLIAQDYARLRVIAVNDRSNDATGQIMDAMFAIAPERLRVLHISDLPAGWLGKVHAMARAARATISRDAPDFLLFTDADVMYRSDAVRRSLVYAVMGGADHLVTVPTTIIRRWDEAALLGFFQIFGMWGARLWKVPDPKSQRDAIGIGAFNMVRRTAYESIGGFEAQKMDILEDLMLARRIKKAGLAQRVAFGRRLVNVHWASGVWGLVEVMTKNVFCAFRFRVSLTLGGCLWLLVFCVAPGVEVFFRATRVPGMITLAAVVWGLWLFQKASGISAWNGLLSPVSASVFVFTLLRSMVTTLRQSGVWWRGTFYSLADLRKYGSLSL